MTQWFHSQLYTQAKWKHMSTQKLGYEWMFIAVLLIIAPKVGTTQNAHQLMCTPISIQWNIIRLSKRNEVLTHATNERPLKIFSVCGQSLSHVPLFANPWTVARQAPLSMGSSRQEYWSRLPFPTPGDLPDPGSKLVSLVPPVLAGGFFTTSAITLNGRRWKHWQKGI